MTFGSAPRLRTCIAIYYAMLVLFGMAGTFLGPMTADHGVGEVLRGGLWIVFITHYFFVSAIAIQHDWLSFLMVFGIPIAITAAAIRLTGWTRNVAVVGLLLVAHVYGLAVGGMNA